MNISEFFRELAPYLNENQGVLAAVLFLVTLLSGWMGYVLRTLLGKPKLKMSVLDGPSFYSIVGTGRVYKNYDCHRTCIALYL